MNHLVISLEQGNPVLKMQDGTFSIITPNAIGRGMSRGFHKFFLILWIAFMMGAIPSCMSDKQLTYMNDQINALNRRVTEAGAELDAIHKNQAELSLEVDRLKGSMGEVSGRIEDSEHVVKRIVERDLGDVDTVRRETDNLSRRIAVLETMLGLETLPPLGDTQDRDVAPGDRGAPSVDEEGSLYDHALALFHDGKFDEAVVNFRNFLRNHPKSDRADNAQFWIGECHMALKQYEQAILAYQEVIRKYPGGNKVPNAMLRQAVAFYEIKDKTSSNLLLQKIIKQYPKSSEAEIARKRLNTLK
jgi:tol-pal system protein YbgF